MGFSVLVTRLLPPRLPPGCLRRPELERRLVEGLLGRLVAVVAGPGYGKSTFLAQAVERLPTPVVWCSCDARIKDSSLLLAHVAAGLARQVPSFRGGLGLAGSTDDQVAEVCNEVAGAISQDFVLVLDDVHTLSGSARKAVALLVQDLPPTAHVVLAGRSPLPFSFARLRAARAVEIGEADLAFTEEETEVLLRELGVDHPPAYAADLHRRAEGWVSGLILASLADRSGSDPGCATSAHFDYLAEELFSGLSARRRSFLLKTSVLDRFSPALAAAVTDDAGAGGVVRGLVADHLFTQRLDGDEEWYRYHHLLREFLRRHLRQVAPEQIPQLHRRAARWWLDSDSRSEAVPHFLAAGEPLAAIDVLEPLVEHMVGTPEAETLAGWLDSIPDHYWADRPRLLAAHAALLLTRAQHEDSLRAFDAAIDALLQRGEQERAATASARLLLSMITAGAPVAERIEAGRRQVARISPRARMLPATRILLATSYAWACRFEEAEQELTAALAPPAWVSPVIRAYAAIGRAFYLTYPLGRVTDARAALEEAIALLERHRSEDELALLAYACVYRGYLLNDLGRHEEALAEGERTEHAFRERGMRRAVGRALTCIRLTALAGLGRWHDLEAEFARGGEELRPAETSSYGYRLRDPAARLAAHRGDVPAVRSHIAAAREQMRAIGLVFDNPMFLCNFARAAWDAGLAALARELADEARHVAATIRAPAQQARAALLGALAAPRALRDHRLTEALCLTARWDLADLWVLRERAVAGPLLAHARGCSLGPPGLAASLLVARDDESRGAVVNGLAEGSISLAAAVARVERRVNATPAAVAALPAVAQGPRSRRRATDLQDADGGHAALTFSTLGGLSVARGGIPVPREAFGRRKPRELLALLLSVDRGVHRDVVLEHLWLGLGDTRGGAALRTALHQLRHALQPELARRSPSSLVVSDGQTYSLILRDGDVFDVAAFRELADVRDEPSTAAIPRLEAAEAAYRGPFLPEWPYADWAEPRRRALEARYRDVLGRLGAALLSAGRADAAARRYQRLVALEPEREGWHRGLMQAYAALGERPLALRQYHACREVLRRELGIEPGAETRALFGRLLRGEHVTPSLPVFR